MPDTIDSEATKAGTRSLKKKMITLTEKQFAGLSEIAKRKGNSRSALIRDIVDVYLQANL